MIEPGNARLTVSRQCELLGMSRSGYYYRPQPVSEEDLLLMRLIDEEYTRHPFFGTRRLADWLGTQGHAVGRDRVRSLMQQLGVAANVRMTRDKTLEFFGNLSLENNGGFASTRTRAGKLDLSPYDALVFKVRGDGRTYYFNIHFPTQQIAFSYRAKFTTEKDKWQEIRIPLKDFRATSFGEEVSDAAPLDPKNIQAIGFLLSDKKAGPFKLEVEWIKGSAAGK